MNCRSSALTHTHTHTAVQSCTINLFPFKVLSDWHARSHCLFKRGNQSNFFHNEWEFYIKQITGPSSAYHKTHSPYSSFPLPTYFCSFCTPSVSCVCTTPTLFCTYPILLPSSSSALHLSAVSVCSLIISTLVAFLTAKQIDNLQLTCILCINHDATHPYLAMPSIWISALILSSFVFLEISTHTFNPSDVPCLPWSWTSPHECPEWVWVSARK